MKTFERYKKELDEYSNGEYVLLEYPETVKSSIRVYHTVCKQIIQVTWTNLVNAGKKCIKTHCRECAYAANGETFRLTLEQFKTKFYTKYPDKKDYKFKSEYTNTNTKIEIFHPVCGNTFSMRPRELMQGNECPTCSRNEVSINKTFTMEEFKTKFYEKYPEKLTYAFPEKDYVNTDVKIKVLHTKCNTEYMIRPRELMQGNECPTCSKKNTTSQGELELRQFVQENYSGEILCNHKGLFENKLRSVDMYLPELKIVIEFDGVYWHSESRGKGKNYHKDRMVELLDVHNIRTIRIFETEWYNKVDTVKSKLLHILGSQCSDIKNKPKIYARKCYIQEITSKIKNSFLNKNHLQGADKSNILLGMYTKDSDELVSVMTFNIKRVSLGNKTTNSKSYELVRFASNSDYIVIGGFSKILKHFVTNYEYEEITTYADLRWSDGNLYDTNGFVFSHISDPSYFYFKDGTQLFHRFNFAKYKIKELYEKNKIESFDEELSEYQNMLNNKYHRLWDNGCLVYKYIRNI